MNKIPKWFINYMTVIGIVGGLVPWIQSYEILINQSANDVSLTAYVLILIAMASWLVYGIWLKDRPMIIANIVSVAGAAFCTILILMFG